MRAIVKLRLCLLLNIHMVCIGTLIYGESVNVQRKLLDNKPCIIWISTCIKIYNNTTLCICTGIRIFNTLRPRRNGRRAADDTFERIFVNENVRISIKISLKFVPKGPINNIPSLVEIMAWRRPGDEPLFQPMMVRLPTQICATRPQWVNDLMCILEMLSIYWLGSLISERLGFMILVSL